MWTWIYIKKKNCIFKEWVLWFLSDPSSFFLVRKCSPKRGTCPPSSSPRRFPLGSSLRVTIAAPKPRPRPSSPKHGEKRLKSNRNRETCKNMQMKTNYLQEAYLPLPVRCMKHLLVNIKEKKIKRNTHTHAQKNKRTNKHCLHQRVNPRKYKFYRLDGSIETYVPSPRCRRFYWPPGWSVCRPSRGRCALGSCCRRSHTWRTAKRPTESRAAVARPVQTYPGAIVTNDDFPALLVHFEPSFNWQFPHG